MNGIDVTSGFGAKPRVGVLMAAFNGVPFISRQLESILTQQDVEVQIYVSVDRSSDGTEALVEALSKADGRICLLPGGQTFGSAARNFFRLLGDVDLAAHAFVAFADQDDIWAPDKLVRAVRGLDAHKADGYSSNVTAFWADGRRDMLISKADPQRRWDHLFESAGPGCTYVLRANMAIALRDCLRARSVEASRVYSHDWLIYAYARVNSYRWHIDPQPSLRYRQHAVNAHGVNIGWPALWKRARRLFGPWGLTQARLVARVSGAEDLPFVRRWSRCRSRDLAWLALQARQCRRQPRDQVMFAILMATLAVVSLMRQHWLRSVPDAGSP